VEGASARPPSAASARTRPRRERALTLSPGALVRRSRRPRCLRRNRRRPSARRSRSRRRRTARTSSEARTRCERRRGRAVRLGSSSCCAVPPCLVSSSSSERDEPSEPRKKGRARAFASRALSSRRARRSTRERGRRKERLQYRHGLETPGSERYILLSPARPDRRERRPNSSFPSPAPPSDRHEAWQANAARRLPVRLGDTLELAAGGKGRGRVREEPGRGPCARQGERGRTPSS